jgi:Zn-finger nucleic acid-binding protein
MNCPRCESPVLAEIDRDGVMIDQCPDCRGVWLDRGELEKLVNKAVREIEEAEGRHEPARPAPRDEPRRDERYDDRRYEDRSRQKPRKKKSWFEGIEDLFGG